MNITGLQLDVDAVTNAPLNPASAQNVTHGITQSQTPHGQPPASAGFAVVSLNGFQ